MKLRNKCVTVNSGTVETFNVPDIINKNQPLQLEIIKHNPKYAIIAYYMLEKTDKGIVKTEVSVYRNLENGIEGSEIYKFRGADKLHHYYSRNYPRFVGLPSKYYTIVKYIHRFIQGV